MIDTSVDVLVGKVDPVVTVPLVLVSVTVVHTTPVSHALKIAGIGSRAHIRSSTTGQPKNRLHVFTQDTTRSCVPVPHEASHPCHGPVSQEWTGGVIAGEVRNGHGVRRR